MNDKALVALEAAKLAENGMVVGLGTGSTANYFIESLAARVRQEGLDVSVVASSTISAVKAASCGLSLRSLAYIDCLDLYVDGADEITPQFTLLKGRGQDLVMEKLLASVAKKFIVVADKSKLVGRLGEKFVIPIEVMPLAWKIVMQSLQKIGAEGTLRLTATGDNVFVSASGNYVLDMRFPTHLAEVEINQLLNAKPGVVEHGIFMGLANLVLIADQGIIEHRVVSK